jgi:hypothetical protein
VPKNENNPPAEATASLGKTEKIRAFDLPRFKRWFGTPPFVSEQEEKDFDEFVLSFESYLDPMDTLIGQKLYEYVLEKYKMIQLLNMGAEAAKQQALHFERVDQAAAQDQQGFDRKGDPESDPPSIMREFFANPFMTSDCPVDSVQDYSNDSLRKSRDVDIALKFEASLDVQIKIDAAINECMKRAKDLLRQIKALSYDLAERLDEEFWLGLIEAVQYRNGHLPR